MERLPAVTQCQVLPGTCQPLSTGISQDTQHSDRPHRATQTFKDLPMPTLCVFLSTCTEVPVPGLGAFSRQHKEF